MNDNLVTVVGNVADSPRRVRLDSGNVTNFRLACPKRRFDRTKQEFIDGATFWVDVECWGELGGNVSHSISKGDPVIVRGEIGTREWEGEHGKRSATQIRAEVVAPNLAKGVADFRRTVRAASAGSSSDPSGPVPQEEVDPGDFDEAAELLAGTDYIPDPATLHSLDPDEALPEPALR